ncbi:hypothetical protein E3P92_01353 [Wallemia ichthyophaga]|uniref:Mitochondrial import inner membrane translocase subunit TIM50 n=1 Tax=Wallemia ichthyophaga (strain EXF-994 / CBS 113033) TaxID=1299270 RepID=R9ABY2_WALI9|nr:uncharacterized protein J056_001545 [Wallemia ichthyophaga EXF-994]TIA74250.1 hypothetical protein E3P91_01062 [Wallemia ichthyophaga]EOQ99713.1 hypothetical protein J056_001545 [Wallemia ichthyophaga EXF-994]TIB16486.1 hypothetical protein E3P92_01353 [Wallemia ichthyophaga]TIB33354.1 hypothetical protein E3P84_02231 [Wallemia ichthyophaga]TIB41236.1 hypothetical protein E3P83_02184 [Wallemia ichthyophaga]
MSPPILRAGILGHVSRTARCASRAGIFVRPMSDDGSAHKAHKPNENEAQETAKKPLPQPSIASNQLDKLVPDLNVSTDEPFRIGGETTGAQAKGKRSMSSIEKRRQMRSRIMLALAGLGAVAGAIHLSRDWEDDSERKEAIERTKKAGESAVIDSWWSRLYNRLRGYTDVFDKPAWSELLPPMMPPPHQRPYTLLVDLEGLLVSSSWDRQHGWRTAKRPGAEYFLGYLSQFYEIVLFTTQPNYTAISVMEKLDPFGAYVPYKLFRESTRYKNGKTVKDLSYLNRDLSKVVVLDTNPENVSAQPENGLILKPWKGEPGNKDLIAHIPFLECVALFNVPDVRPVLQKYNGTNIPQEWAKVEEKMREKQIENWKNQGGQPKKSGWGFGGGNSSMRPPTSPVNFSTDSGKGQPPLSYLDLKRREAQAIYKEEQKYWRDNKEEFTKIIEEDTKRQTDALKGQLWGMVGVQSGEQPKPAN